METVVAETIMEQLGRGTFTMLGTDQYDIMAMERGLQFGVKGSRKANLIRVTLEADDTYTVAFFKFSPTKLTRKEVGRFSDVYAEQLHQVIESFTGLCTRMPNVRFA